MRKALKTFLPVLVGLFFPFIYDRIDSRLYPRTFEEYGDGGMRALWAFYYILFPIIIIILCVFQRFIILPLWDKARLKLNYTITKILINAVVISVVFGLLLGYTFWKSQFGLRDLVISVWIMICLQSVYWISNILTIYYLDMHYIPNSMSKTS